MFTAVYDEYSSQAFNNNERDYLLKPADAKELNKAIQRFRHYSFNKKLEGKSTLQAPKTNDTDRLAVITYNSEMRILRVSDIGYFRYSNRRKIWEIALNDHSFLSLKKGTKASTILDFSSKFAQCHQSFIVNIDNLMLIGSSSLILFPPFNEDEVLLGRSYRKEIQSQFTCI